MSTILLPGFVWGRMLGAPTGYGGQLHDCGETGAFRKPFGENLIGPNCEDPTKVYWDCGGGP